MKAGLGATIFSACGLGALMVTGTLAADSRLDLVIGGEAYDGAPRFSVIFDGTELGVAEVSAAIDTVKTGTFAEAGDKAAHVQQIGFTIPEEVFRPGGEVRVRLLNEAWGGEGSTHDRNLYLASVSVNGRSVTLSGLDTQSTRDDNEIETLGEFLVLRDGNVEAVSRAPSTGWPLPGQLDGQVAIAASGEAGLRETADSVAAVAEEATGDEEGPQPVPIRAIAATPPADGADREEDEDMAIETASIGNAAPPDQAACTRDELYNVVGFNENSNDLTPRLMARLDQVIADIGKQKCKLTVTGYSSKQGDHATNALFAIERAQNVLAYLRENDVPFDRATATGGGATEQFGDSFSANRRVVITVAP